MQTDEWGDLHDKTLISLNLDWGARELRMRVGKWPNGGWEIVATGLIQLDCARRDPWGPSELVLDVLGPVPLVDGVVGLEVQLQSGDLLRLEARRIWLENIG